MLRWYYAPDCMSCVTSKVSVLGTKSDERFRAKKFPLRELESWDLCGVLRGDGCRRVACHWGGSHVLQVDK